MKEPRFFFLITTQQFRLTLLEWSLRDAEKYKTSTTREIHEKVKDQRFLIRWQRIKKKKNIYIYRRSETKNKRSSDREERRKRRDRGEGKRRIRRERRDRQRVAAGLSPCRPSPPPGITNASIRATTSASWGLNYFLIRSFQASLTGSCIMPHNAPYACWTTNARTSPSASPPRTIFLHRRRPPPPLHRVLLVHLRLPGTLYPREELRVRDCEAYSTQTRGSCLDPLASDSTEYSTSAGAAAYSTCDSNGLGIWILFGYIWMAIFLYK